jgi:hypothetical protein
MGIRNRVNKLYPWLRPVPDGESAAGCAEACAVCTGGFGGGDCEEGVSEYAVGEA